MFGCSTLGFTELKQFVEDKIIGITSKNFDWNGIFLRDVLKLSLDRHSVCRVFRTVQMIRWNLITITKPLCLKHLINKCHRVVDSALGHMAMERARLVTLLANVNLPCAHFVRECVLLLVASYILEREKLYDVSGIKNNEEFSITKKWEENTLPSKREQCAKLCSIFASEKDDDYSDSIRNAVCLSVKQVLILSYVENNIFNLRINPLETLLACVDQLDTDVLLFQVAKKCIDYPPFKALYTSRYTCPCKAKCSRGIKVETALNLVYCKKCLCIFPINKTADIITLMLSFRQICGKCGSDFLSTFSLYKLLENEKLCKYTESEGGWKMCDRSRVCYDRIQFDMDVQGKTHYCSNNEWTCIELLEKEMVCTNNTIKICIGCYCSLWCSCLNFKCQTKDWLVIRNRICQATKEQVKNFIYRR